MFVWFVSNSEKDFVEEKRLLNNEKERNEKVLIAKRSKSIICHYCKLQGHIERYCYEKKNDLENKVLQVNSVVGESSNKDIIQIISLCLFVTRIKSIFLFLILEQVVIVYICKIIL